MKPFLKWTGGKTRTLKTLLPYLLSIFDESKHTYVEPFLGGGAVAFALRPSRAILNDVNPNLMSCYWCLKTYATDLVSVLKELEETYHTLDMDQRKTMFLARRDTYNQIKLHECVDLSTQPKQLLLDIASCFIFLNKTSFNGIYRENASGKYNVPFGKYTSIHLHAGLTQVAEYLQQPGITLSNCSFEHVLDTYCTEEYVYYFDPPYMECNESKFNAYNANRFTLHQHQRILEFMTTHTSLCSNSNATQLLNNLSPTLYFTRLSIARCISSTQSTRRKQEEVIVYTSSLQQRINTIREQTELYCRGDSTFTSRDDELDFLRQPLLAVLCRKQLGSVNTGVLSEFMIYDACVRHGIPIESPTTLQCRVRPDWKITLHGTSYYLEIKSRSYTCTGTASEKLDSIPRKYAKVFAETGIRTLIVFAAKQVSEKNALELLHPDTEYCRRFLQTSSDFGIEAWLTYHDFLNKIDS